jgi:hypothetical protein
MKGSACDPFWRKKFNVEKTMSSDGALISSLLIPVVLTAIALTRGKATREEKLTLLMLGGRRGDEIVCGCTHHLVGYFECSEGLSKNIKDASAVVAVFALVADNIQLFNEE